MKPVERVRGQSRDSLIFRLASGNICNRSEILQARFCLLNQSEVFQLKTILKIKNVSAEKVFIFRSLRISIAIF